MLTTGCQEIRRAACRTAGFAVVLVAQQAVEFTGHQFAVRIKLTQKTRRTPKAHRVRYPVQVIVARRQHMRLLVVQVLDAVLDTAQKIVSARQRVSRVLRHQVGFGQALQRVYRAARAQLGELPAAHHLQQLHGELDFTNTTA